MALQGKQFSSLAESTTKFPDSMLLSISPQYPFNSLQVQEYLTRFESIPDMLELDHLTVSGDVTFGKQVSLKVSRGRLSARDLFGSLNRTALRGQQLQFEKLCFHSLPVKSGPD